MPSGHHLRQRLKCSLNASLNATAFDRMLHMAPEIDLDVTQTKQGLTTSTMATQQSTQVQTWPDLLCHQPETKDAPKSLFIPTGSRFCTC